MMCREWVVLGAAFGCFLGVFCKDDVCEGEGGGRLFFLVVSTSSFRVATKKSCSMPTMKRRKRFWGALSNDHEGGQFPSFRVGLSFGSFGRGGPR